MLKGQTVIDKDVLSRADGVKLATVKDLVISKDHTRVVALLTADGGLFSKARMVPISKVVSIGKDAVIVTDSNADMAAEDDPTVKESLDSKDRLIGKAVYTDHGDEQAVVNDIHFDEKSGSIVGLELAGGVLENSSDGTAYLPIEEVISIGQHAVMIRSQAVPALLEQASGGQAAARKAGEGQGQAG
ncbi:MAG TPA: PRC-barrel domain-containing protein [Chloroflexia bacterium]|nr:PRC-barrel domain-containing protein [Chloroflexia bacterium]